MRHRFTSGSACLRPTLAPTGCGSAIRPSRSIPSLVRRTRTPICSAPQRDRGCGCPGGLRLGWPGSPEAAEGRAGYGRLPTAALRTDPGAPSPGRCPEPEGRRSWSGYDGLSPSVLPTRHALARGQDPGTNTLARAVPTARHGPAVHRSPDRARPSLGGAWGTKNGRDLVRPPFFVLGRSPGGA